MLFDVFQIQEEAFYVCDIGDIVRKHKEWKMKLPRVEPFYGKYMLLFKFMVQIWVLCLWYIHTRAESLPCRYQSWIQFPEG